jgi:hypothetical protein
MSPVYTTPSHLSKIHHNSRFVSYTAHIWRDVESNKPITVASRYEVKKRLRLLEHWHRGFASHSMHVWTHTRVLSMLVLSCEGVDFTINRSAVQRILLNVGSIHTFRFSLNWNRPEGLSVKMLREKNKKRPKLIEVNLIVKLCRSSTRTRGTFCSLFIMHTHWAVWIKINCGRFILTRTIFAKGHSVA